DGYRGVAQTQSTQGLAPAECVHVLEDVVEIAALRFDVHVDDVDLVILVQLVAQPGGDRDSSFGQLFEDVAHLASDLVHQVDLVSFTDVRPVEADLCFEVLAGGGGRGEGGLPQRVM